MDIRVSKFRETIELLNPVVPKKPSVKSLAYILLKDGQAVATDLESMVIAPMPEADIEALIPVKDIIQMIQYVPGTEMLTLKVTKKKLKVSWSDGSSSFPLEDTEKFPAVPEFTPVAEESLNGDILIPAMESLSGYVATEGSRAVLTGVTLILGKHVRVAAGDGYRMADKQLDLTFPMEFINVLPISAVSLLQHLWKKVPRTPPPSDSLVPILTAKKMVSVGHDGEKAIRFQFSQGISAIVKFIQGDPPEWLKLVPTGDPILKVQMFAPDLELAINRVKNVAKEGAGRIRIDFKDDQAVVSAKEGDLDAESSISTINAEGVPNRLAIHLPYIMGYIKGKEGIVTISWTGETTPIIFQSLGKPRVLIMPMKYD
jgi:DNA polymerase III sliding clamp (beta) subunit (PCNA family)